MALITNKPRSREWLSREVESYLTDRDKSSFRCLNADPLFPFRPSRVVEFFYRIRKSNASKPFAPYVLILKGAEDHNGALSTFSSRWNIERLAETHRVILRIFNPPGTTQRTDIGTRVEQLVREQGAVPDACIFGDHGAEDRLGCLKYAASSITKDDFAILGPACTLILWSCCTGKELAPKMAHYSAREVVAASEVVDSDNTFFYWREDTGRLSMASFSPDMRQLMQTFSSNHPPYFYPVSSELRSKCFSEMDAYVKQKGNDSDGLFGLGKFYQAKKCHQEAFTAFARAASLGNSLSLESIEDCFRKGGKLGRSIEWLLESARAGHTNPQVRLANYYEQGVGGLQKNDRSALYWFQRAEAASPIAKYKVGCYLLNGVGGLVKNTRKGLEKIREASCEGLSPANALLGSVYQFGRHGIKPDLHQAIHYYERAANGGDLSAPMTLRHLYRLLGKREKSLQWLQKAAGCGNAEAQYELGMLYLYGKEGAPKDPTQAAYWFEKAAAMGNSNAQYKLAIMHLYGLCDLLESLPKALYWFQQAANKGHIKANGCLRSFSQHYQYTHPYTHPSEQTIAPSQGQPPLHTPTPNFIAPEGLYYLGCYYEHHKHDLLKAREYYIEAAELGDTQAQQALKRLSS